MTTPPFEALRADLRRVMAGRSENLLLLERVDSTNLLARELLAALPAAAYPPSPTFIVAHHQTAGRGRLGRTFESPPGTGLYVSLLRPLGEGAPRDLLPIAVGVALAGGLRALGVGSCRLKWPNDLLGREGKLGGILIESVAPRPGAESVLVIGFGVNLHDPGGRPPARGATSMESEGVPKSAAEVFAAVAPELARLDERLSSPERLVADYRALLKHRPGDRLRWHQEERTLEGSYVDVEERGRLLLDTPEGRRVIAVGDIIEE